MESRDRGWNGGSIARQGYRSFPEELNIEGESVQIQQCIGSGVWGHSLWDHFVALSTWRSHCFFLFLNGLREKKEEGYHFLYHIQTPLKSNNIARMV